MSLCLIGVLIGFVGLAQGEYTYRIFDVPNPDFGFPTETDTWPTAIEGTKIVGTHFIDTFSFFYDGTDFKRAIQAPGAMDTWFMGVSGKKIVGSCDGINCLGGHEGGFIYDGVNYIPFSVPGYTSYPVGIEGEKIVGSYYDAGVYRGFFYNGATFTALNYPGARTTSPEGISGNKIAGTYEDSSGVDHGFIYDGAAFTTLDCPGATSTALYSISGNKILGKCGQSFVYDGATFTTLAFPGSSYMNPTGISGSTIVGWVSLPFAVRDVHTAWGGTHGFIATPDTFPSTALLDGFNRADTQGPPSDDWTPQYGGLKIVNNQCMGTGTGPWNAAYWTGATFGPESEVYATIAALPARGEEITLGLRLSPDLTGYLVGFRMGTGIRIQRMDENGFVQLGRTIRITPKAGDRIGARMVGNKLTLWYDNGTGWTDLLTVTDNRYKGTGYVGADVQGTTGAIDDFGGGTYVVPFPSTGVLDTFNRRDTQGPPSRKWTNKYEGGLKVSNNQCMGTDGGPANIGFYTGSFFGPDAEVFATMTSLPADGEQIALGLRLSPTGLSGYQVGFKIGTGVQVFRIDNFTWTQLGKDITVFMPNAGDKIGARMVGDKLTVWYNPQGQGWVNLATVTDSTYTGAGYLGVDVQGTVAAIDDFGGGTYLKR
ncbi:MAG TPA: hypothetical protein VGJ94_17995 [Syntrophorhabdaceae bacterium]